MLKDAQVSWGVKHEQSQGANFSRDLPIQFKLLLTIPLLWVWCLFAYHASVALVWNWQLLTILATFTSMYGLLLNSLLAPKRINFVVVYGSYLVASHLGVVICEVLIPDNLRDFAYRNNLGWWVIDWFYSVEAHYAVVLSGLGITSFLLVSTLSHIVRGTPRTFAIPTLSQKGDPITFRVGLILLILCTIYTLYLIAIGVMSIDGTYDAHLTALVGHEYNYGWYSYFLASCMTLIVATATDKQIRAVLPLFLFIAIIHFLNGNRSEILYGFAASIAVLGIRGVKPNLYLVIIASVLLFIIIPLIRQFRNVPVDERSFQSLSLNFTEPFVELGFQLRPLTLTVGWLQNGEEPARGGTYWLPIQRLVGLIFPFIERPPIEGELFIVGRLPGLGYTIIAEAYFNYEVLGVVVVMGGIGWILVALGNSITSRQLGIAGVIVAILINNQRNSFIFVPGQVFSTLLLLGMIIFFSKFFSNGKLKTDRD